MWHVSYFFPSLPIKKCYAIMHVSLCSCIISTKSEPCYSNVEWRNLFSICCVLQNSNGLTEKVVCFRTSPNNFPDVCVNLFYLAANLKSCIYRKVRLYCIRIWRFKTATSCLEYVQDVYLVVI